MSWNHGEVTVVPYEIKKPKNAYKFWKPSWKANYKGEEFWIEKPTKDHHSYGDGYDVNFEWKGRHPRNAMGHVTPKLIGLTKLKTMPQVKKLIRTFVDDMKAGKIVCGETGIPLTMNSMAGCTACKVYNQWDMDNLGMYHRKNMYSHKRLDDGSELFPSHSCKWHTKLDVIEKMKEAGEFKEKKEHDIYQHKSKRYIKNKIDVDALVPDSELIAMFNPYRELAKRRLKMKAEESKLNPFLIAAGFITLITYLKS